MILRRMLIALTVSLVVAVVATAGFPLASRYDDMVALFTEWRQFQKAKLVEGVPDYSAAAMSAQHGALPAFRDRLAKLDTSGWTIPQQVDYHIVRAEMNGLDFDHRVLRPWARNPAFYVLVFGSQSDQPAREGPHMDGSIELWTYQFPLAPEKGQELRTRLATIPAVLTQARGNLVEDAKDLWTFGIRSINGQSQTLSTLAERVRGSDMELDSTVHRARVATDEFRAWLEREAPRKNGKSGVGEENYDWYLKNVRLLNQTWKDQVALMRRELYRSRAALDLEESRNSRLPPLTPITDSATWNRRFAEAVTEYISFLRDRQIVSLKPYMEPALRARMGRFSAGPREFFNEVNYRDPVIMRTHDYHWIDLAWMANDPHSSPIRRGPLLYNIFDTRTEGFATAMEEMMMHAGFVDNHPRARELIYVLVAQRAARALGDLMMHANQFSLEQAADFATSQTPRNWLRKDGTTVWGEQHLYLQQPTYGTSYLIGKSEIEKLFAERAKQLGDGFTMRRFMDDLNGIGMIPITLVRWEMTGQGDEVMAVTRADRN